nr:unnamed protein product [Callosobruchus chinensis]
MVANFNVSKKQASSMEDKCQNINRNSLGGALLGVITQARQQGRLVCGLNSAIARMAASPEDVVCCVLPQSNVDPAQHIHTVLLQAVCYENYIPVIQVDSSEKLAEYCGFPAKSCNCAIILRDDNEPVTPDEDPPMSPTERILADFYECTLQEFPRPVIQLPS